jgi:hypothetical protein
VRRLVWPLFPVACFWACGAALPRSEAAVPGAAAGATAVVGTTERTAGEVVESPLEAESPAPVPGGLDADALVALTRDECLAKLDEWAVPYEVVADAPQAIDAPVRLTGPVAGVSFVIPWDVTNHHDVLDCRLAAALAEWAVLLRERGVVEVRLYSFYRSGGRGGVTSARARGQLSQHAFGLAIDARWFVREDGELLDVQADFVDPGTDDTCAGAVDDERGAELLDLFCCAWAVRLFHVQLSPAHNAQHENHYHLDLNGANGGWYLD